MKWLVTQSVQDGWPGSRVSRCQLEASGKGSTGGMMHAASPKEMQAAHKELLLDTAYKLLIGEGWSQTR